MKKVKLKYLATIFLIVLLSFNVSFAGGPSDIYNYFKNGETISALDFTNITNTVYSIIIWVGYAVAIFVVLITGIQFLTAGPQKKAQLKEKLWIIFLGVFILVAGVSILNIAVTIVENTPITL